MGTENPSFAGDVHDKFDPHVDDVGNAGDMETDIAEANKARKPKFAEGTKEIPLSEADLLEVEEIPESSQKQTNAVKTETAQALAALNQALAERAREEAIEKIRKDIADTLKN